MDASDLIIVPIYLFIIYQVLFFVRKKECKNLIIKKYFIPAATAKIIGAVALGLVYYFYYRGGDTVQYFRGSKILHDLLINQPALGLESLFRNCKTPLSFDLHRHWAGYSYIQDNGSFFIVRIAAVLSLFAFNSYTVIAILFGMFSFSGSWALFRTLVVIYPNLHKQLATAVFFIPSVVFWGSGLMKDSLTFGAIGWFFYGFYHLILVKDSFRKPIIMLIISTFILVHVKIYILLSLIPSLSVWWFLLYNQQIKSKVTRIILLPVVFGVAIGFGFFAAGRIAEQDEQYRMENLSSKAKITNEWLSYMSQLDKGSYYDLGITDYSPLGLLKSFPKAVNVTLFRPYIWEARKPIMVMSSLESIFFLLFTIFTIYKVGLLNSLSITRNNPMVFSFLIFSLVLSFAVGVTSANFGTLVRYKIPIMPFYIASFFVIRHVFEEEKLKIKKAKIISFVEPKSDA